MNRQTYLINNISVNDVLARARVLFIKNMFLLLFLIKQIHFTKGPFVRKTDIGGHLKESFQFNIKVQEGDELVIGKFTFASFKLRQG